MKLLSLLIASAAVLVASPALAVSTVEAGPKLRAIHRSDGETTGKYIVKFKGGASRRAWAEKLGLSPEHSFNIINGFSGTCRC